MNDHIPALTTNELQAALNDMLDASARAIYAAGREYSDRLPADARAYAALLASGRIAPAVYIELPPDGARIALGYVETSGAFHPIFSWPVPEQHATSNAVN